MKSSSYGGPHYPVLSWMLKVFWTVSCPCLNAVFSAGCCDVYVLIPHNNDDLLYVQLSFDIVVYISVLVTVTEWYRTKHPMHCGHFDLLCVPKSFNHSWSIHQSSLTNTSRHLVAKQEETRPRPGLYCCKQCWGILCLAENILVCVAHTSSSVGLGT
jgi:hypothetical protein